MAVIRWTLCELDEMVARNANGVHGVDEATHAVTLGRLYAEIELARHEYTTTMIGLTP